MAKITKVDIDKALEKFRLFKQYKTNLEQRIIENESWYRLHMWDAIGRAKGKDRDPEPTSAWLMNSLMNKHADAMDNFPAPLFLPREASDEQEAKRLQQIVPIILERNDYQKVYSDSWWYKLKMGTRLEGVFWDNEIDNGLGDVKVVGIDLLNFYWQPQIKDIQDSSDIFLISLAEKDDLERQYPELKDKLTGSGTSDYVRYTSYEGDNHIDDDKKVIVYDWYYKKVNKDGVKQLHFCKFVEGHVLYASENDSAYSETGYYEHGMYPFVADTFFPNEDSWVGFGYLDIMKSPQVYIDKLDQMILKNTAMTGKTRYFKSNGTNVNMEQFKNWDEEIVNVDGQIDETRLREIRVTPIPSFIINHYESKITELKETSGNRDFSQGSTVTGVTSGTAISALQEAGSKLSRDMVKTSYNAYKKMIELVFGTMKQFYTEDRYFRIESPNGTEYVAFNNSGITNQESIGADGMAITRSPIFDIRVQAQKQSPFSREAQNERAKELYGLGVFVPQNATQSLAMLEMMEFEGIEKVRETIRKNDIKEQVFQQLIQLATQMAQAVDQANMNNGLPSQMLGRVQQLLAQLDGGQMAMPSEEPKLQSEDQINNERRGDNSLANKQRLKTVNATKPQ